MSNFDAFGENGKRFATKAALRRAVQAGENVRFVDTTAFGGRGTVTAEDLDPGDVIIGPNPYERREWYANVKSTRNGSLRVV